MTSNFMVKHNPAYQDKDYVAFPTPLPNELEESEQEKQADCATTVTKPTPAPWASAEPASEVSEQGGEEENAVEGSYKGRTFQQAQAQIIKELMVYQDPERLVVRPGPSGLQADCYLQRTRDLLSLRQSTTPYSYQLLRYDQESCVPKGYSQASQWPTWTTKRHWADRVQDVGFVGGRIQQDLGECEDLQ